MAIQDELPRSRITLTYRTTISGEPETVKLPLRLLILGDFSGGTSADRREKDANGQDKLANGKPVEIDLEARRMRSVNGSNLDNLMKDMRMTLDLTDKVENHIDGGKLEAKLPIDKMKSFHPDEIAQHVPKLKGLLLLRKLLAEMQSMIDNRKDLRNAIYEIFKDEAKRNALKDAVKVSHKSLVLPPGNTAPPPAQ